MRDLLVLSIVFIGVILTLRRAWFGVLLWTWISIMNPHQMTWGFAYFAPVAAMAAVATLLALLYTKERQSPFQGIPVWWLFAFTIWMTLSWLFAYDFAGDYELWNRSIKIYLMSFIALALLSTKNHILAFAWVTTGSIAILAAKGGLFTILTGGNYRVWGPGGFIGENNAFALATIITLPLVHFLQLQLSKPWQRHAMSVIMLLCVASSLGSYSRGASLALAAMGLVFWWRSERKGLITIILMIVLLALLPMMPEHWWARMETIKTYEDDTSAMGRINAWIVAWEVAKNNLFGAGMSYQHQLYFSMFGVYETVVRAAHSVYFQILGNHGFIGLLLYLGIWISTYRTAGWLRKNAIHIEETVWTAQLGSMVQVALVGFAVGGAFLSLAYFDLSYNMLIMVVLAKKWVESKAWVNQKQMSILESMGLVKPKTTLQSS